MGKELSLNKKNYLIPLDNVFYLQTLINNSNKYTDKSSNNLEYEFSNYPSFS